MKKKPEAEITKTAAIKLDKEGSAVEVVAEGFGKFAQRILQEAKEHNIRVLQNGEMLKRLSNIDLLEEIPQELQPAIEEVLKYLNKVDLSRGKDFEK